MFRQHLIQGTMKNHDLSKLVHKFSLEVEVVRPQYFLLFVFVRRLVLCYTAPSTQLHDANPQRIRNIPREFFP